MDEIFPVWRPGDHPKRAACVSNLIVVKLPESDGPNQALQLVDGEDGGRRIVDGGRESLGGDIDHDTEGGGGSLVDDALGTEGDGAAKSALVDVRSAVNSKQHLVDTEEIADHRRELDHGIGFPCHELQLLDVDREDDGGLADMRHDGAR